MACRPTRAAGSPPPPATMPSTACAARHAGGTPQRGGGALTRQRRSRHAQEVGPVPDDRLRLIFTCCHPALSTGRAALTLRLLGGLSTEQVARAAPGDRSHDGAPAGTGQAQDQGRTDPLPRARGARATRPPPPRAGRRLPHLQRRAEQPSRTRSVRGGDPAGALLAALMPDEPEVAGLLALLLLTESRRASRPGPTAPWCCSASRTTRWDRALIAEGQAIVRRCLGRNQPGIYQLQAAINAVHASTPRPSSRPIGCRSSPCTTSCWWSPPPVVALNRAIAIGEVQGRRCAGAGGPAGAGQLLPLPRHPC